MYKHISAASPFVISLNCDKDTYSCEELRLDMAVHRAAAPWIALGVDGKVLAAGLLRLPRVVLASIHSAPLAAGPEEQNAPRQIGRIVNQECDSNISSEQGHFLLPTPQENVTNAAAPRNVPKLPTNNSIAANPTLTSD